jgi:acetyltransferase-like isoleucine patch superfamily enzyme
MAHDHCRSIKTDTYIGHDCVIGVNSIIMPGVKIGNEVVIGSGSVVTKDIPDNCIAVGNPAKVIKTNIHVYNGKIQDV